MAPSRTTRRPHALTPRSQSQPDRRSTSLGGKPARASTLIDELTLPLDDAITNDGRVDGRPKMVGTPSARKRSCPNTPHKLTTYLPERTYIWARGQAHAATSAGAATSIADVLRLALEQLRDRGDDRVQSDLVGR